MTVQQSQRNLESGDSAKKFKYLPLTISIGRPIIFDLSTIFLTGLFVLDSRYPVPEDGLRRLLILKDKLEWVINERAMAYGGSEHPKHRLMRYHQFFVDRILDGERVLDVGCGYGAVARTIARECPNCVVTGMDMYEPMIVNMYACMWVHTYVCMHA